MTDPSYGTRAASSSAIPHRPFAVVVLAAGEGTRMKSTRPKVLHGFAGRSLLGHVLAACAPLDAERTIVVVGHRRDDVQAHLDQTGQPVTTVVQEPQRGTGHAVRIAMDALPPEEGGTIVVLPGDTPLLQPTSLLPCSLSTIAVAPPRPCLRASSTTRPGTDESFAMGNGSRGSSSRKTLPARNSRSARSPPECTRSTAALRTALRRLSTDNAQGEEYLPDVVGILVGDGRRVAVSFRRATFPASTIASSSPRLIRSTTVDCSTLTCEPASPSSTQRPPGSMPACTSRRTSPCTRRSTCTARRSFMTARRSARTSP